MSWIPASPETGWKDAGSNSDRWISVVMDSPSPKASRDLHEWVESLPGVSYADVVYVGFDQPQSVPSAN